MKIYFTILSVVLCCACSKPNVTAVDAIVAAQPSSSSKVYAYDANSNSCKTNDGEIGLNAGIPGECVDVSSHKFDSQNFSGLNLKGANFQNSSLKNAKFTSADLSGANLLGTDLTGADMTGAITLNAKLDRTPASALPPPTPITWTFCANENENCSFKGSVVIRYGANDTFTVAVATDGASCSNTTFGDPLVGIVKHCEVLSSTDLTSILVQNTSSWQHCSDEHGTCSFAGTKLVRYGQESTFVMKIVTDGVSCSNSVFGDPLFGTFKRCDYLPNLDLASVLPPESPSAWRFCSDENGQCHFTGTKLVRYGANSTYVVQTLTDGVSCSNSVFGDPLYGIFKHCEIQNLP